MLRPTVALLCLLAPLAGCLGGEPAPAAKDDALEPGDVDTVTPDTPKPKRDPNSRWHYHNYWGTSDTLVLMSENVTLPLVVEDGVRIGRTPEAEFTLPYGKLVPPETGLLNVTIHFEPTAGAPFTGLNFSYLPAGAVNFTTVPVEPGATVTIPVSYDQTDVPHRGSSAWRFRLGPADQNGLAVANGTAHVVVEARIGRPLLIDPPHFDAWRGRTQILLAHVVANASVVKLADDRYLEGALGGASARRHVYEVRLENGSVVPESTREVVVFLAWNATQGSGKPLLAYAEDNSPSNGTLAPTRDEPGLREFRVPIGIGMVDSPYANQSTWRFYVLVEGNPGTPFAGTFEIHAIAEKRS